MLNRKDEELLELIKTISSDDLFSTRDVNGEPYLKSIFRLHQVIFGETCSTCGTKIAGYIKKIKLYNPNTTKIMSNSRYILAGNNTLVVPGTSKAYSNHNITDEIAVGFLADNLNRKSLFSKVPQDFEQDIEDFRKTGTLKVRVEKEAKAPKVIKLSKKVEAEKVEAEKVEAEKVEAEKDEADELLG